MSSTTHCAWPASARSFGAAASWVRTNGESATRPTGRSTSAREGAAASSSSSPVPPSARAAASAAMSVFEAAARVATTANGVPLSRSWAAMSRPARRDAPTTLSALMLSPPWETKSRSSATGAQLAPRRRPSTSATTRVSTSSAGVRASRILSCTCGAGRAERSTLPPTVTGNASSTTTWAGTRCDGARRARPSRTAPASRRAPRDGTTCATRLASSSRPCTPTTAPATPGTSCSSASTSAGSTR